MGAEEDAAGGTAGPLRDGKGDRLSSGTPLTRFCQAALGISLDAFCRTVIRGEEHYSRAPATLAVANHRRDLDAPLIGRILRRRHRGIVVSPYVVAREDLFRRGFLQDHLTTWPEALRWLMAPIDAAGYLRTIRVHPMRRIPERTLGEVLDDILLHEGDLALERVFRPAAARRLAALAGGEPATVSIRRIRGARFRRVRLERWAFRRLRRERFRALVPHTRAAIAAQLRLFAEALDRGETVLLEPEGATSIDGGFGRPRGALHALLELPRCSPRVLPIGITYDFMAPGRPWAFVNFGREILDLKGVGRRECDARVTRAILKQMTVTASQLAGRRLLSARADEARAAGSGALTARDIEHALADGAQEARRAGVPVDARLLDPSARRKRVHGFLAYALRAGLLSREGGRYRVSPSAHTRNGAALPGSLGWTEPARALEYAAQELSLVVPAGRSFA